MKRVCDIDYEVKFPGVKFVAPELTFVNEYVKIGYGTYVEPFVVLKCASIGEHCKLLSGAYIVGSTIEERSVVQGRVESCKRIRHRAFIGKFAELKRCETGQDFKAKHYCYLGDAKIGHYVNIGAGVITANYDGKDKNETIIGNNVFVGINVNLIAPLTIGNNVEIAAGVTLNKTIVPDNSFVKPKKIKIDPEAEKPIALRPGGREIEVVRNRKR